MASDPMMPAADELSIQGTGEETTDPYADRDAVRSRIRDRKVDWKRGTELLKRNAWRNLLYYRGHQWVVYSRSLSAWRPIRQRGGGSLPVTNRFSSTMDAFNSVLARVEPVPTFRPATDSPEDQATADVCTRAIEVIDEESDIRLQRQILAVWAGFTGGAWLERGYDPSPEYGTRVIQHERCPTCGVVQPPSEEQLCQAPECGTPTIPAVDDQGQPVGHPTPIGRMYADVGTIFEMSFDASIWNWSLQRECCRDKSLSVQEAKRRWPDYADQIVPDSGVGPGEVYQQQLPLLAGYTEELGAGLGPVTPSRAPNTRVTETWYWSMPDAEYPEGLLAIQLGQQLMVKVGPLPYFDMREDGSKEYFLPITFFPTKLFPGSAYPKTVADDLALKQRQRNQLEARIMTALDRMANPVWLVPEGSNITNFTGEAGQVLTYNAFGPSPRGPERVPGQSPPAGLFQWIEQIDRDFEELSGAFDIIKGQRPAGVSAGVALQMLQERANSRFGPMFTLWESSWATTTKHAIAIFRQFATEPRLLKLLGKNGKWQMEKFMGADLVGRVDVIAEAGSGMPRSTLVDRAAFEQAANLGLINMRDPEIQQKGRELFNLAQFVPGFRDDTKNCAMQNEQFEALADNPHAVDAIGQLLASIKQQGQQAQQQAQQTGQPPPPPPGYNDVVGMLAQQGIKVPKIRPSVDNHGIYTLELGNWLKEEYTQSLPQPIQDLAEAKHMEHQKAMQDAQGGPPPPKVAVNLRGDLLPDQSSQLAGLPPPAPPGPGPQQGGSSMLTTPNIIQRPGRRPPSPTASGSSAARLTGEVNEMGQQAGRAG